jgi:hypothetical protein
MDQRAALQMQLLQPPLLHMNQGLNEKCIAENFHKMDVKQFHLSHITFYLPKFTE